MSCSKIFLIVLGALFSPVLAQAQPGSLADIRARAAQGDSTALLSLSELFQFGGKGLAPNPDSAKSYLTKAAAKGHPEALYLLGIQETAAIYDAKTFNLGLKHLEAAADKGNVLAYLRLSQIWRTKDPGTVQDAWFDLGKGYQYAEKAALAGNLEGMLLTATLAYEGKGIPKNDSIAHSWYRKAEAQFNNCEAQIRLGDFAFEGRPNGKRDPFLANTWYQKAFSNKSQTIEQRTRADVGIHRVDQILKATHNLMLQGSGLIPAGVFEYQLRAE